MNGVVYRMTSHVDPRPGGRSLIMIAFTAVVLIAVGAASAAPRRARPRHTIRSAIARSTTIEARLLAKVAPLDPPGPQRSRHCLGGAGIRPGW